MTYFLHGYIIIIIYSYNINLTLVKDNNIILLVDCILLPLLLTIDDLRYC